MNLETLQEKLTEKLNRSLIGAHVLIDNLRVIDESSRKTAAYSDPAYIPFYYYLGTLIQPKIVLEIGFRLGLFTSCFVRGCKTVERILGFQERTDSFYSERLGRANVRDNFKGQLDIYVGNVIDEEFSSKLANTALDLVIINEEVEYDKHIAYLDVIWPYVSNDGLVVMDYVLGHKPAGNALNDFCKNKNRKPVYVKTRYGVGIIQK